MCAALDTHGWEPAPEMERPDGPDERPVDRPVEPWADHRELLPQASLFGPDGGAGA
jgi:hypothetical protein